jgi:hypothetical protein
MAIKTVIAVISAIALLVGIPATCNDKCSFGKIGFVIYAAYLLLIADEEIDNWKSMTESLRASHSGNHQAIKLSENFFKARRWRG